MKNEVESQLSAMFDGELPAAECELLSRRIDRDEKLRARWARYVLIGASMRYEPVATASAGFAGRISAAVGALEAVPTTALARRSRLSPPRLMWQSALAAALVVAVAGLSIAMLRNAALNSSPGELRAERGAVDRAGTQPASLPAALAPGSQTQTLWSYVTPSAGERSGVVMPLRSELADYIVAHSEYSTPLMRPDLLSALVSGEQGLDESAAGSRAPSSVVVAHPSSGTDEVDVPAVASPARR